jgi:hypothetical protein
MYFLVIRKLVANLQVFVVGIDGQVVLRRICGTRIRGIRRSGRRANRVGVLDLEHLSGVPFSFRNKK